MYNEFRLSVLRELVQKGLDDDFLRQIMGVVDRVGSEFEVTRKETSLATMDQTLPRIMMEYLACRSIEGLSNETLRNYKLALAHFLATMRKPLNMIETNDIRAYLYKYQQDRGISNRSLDKLRNTLSGFFHWAFSEGKIEKDPMMSVRPIKYTVKHKAALSQLELEYIRKQCYGLREKAIVELLYSTGCRVSELCNMKKSDIDWDNGSINIFGKGSKYRTCFLNAKAYVALKDYLSSRDDNDEHVIVSERGSHGGLTRYAIEHIISEISKRAYRHTGKKVTPHIFRHTTVTTALRAGMPLQNVSKMVGHERVETTMVYADIDNLEVHRDHMKYVI